MFGIKKTKEIEKENEALRKEVRYLRTGWREWQEYAEELTEFYESKNEQQQLKINELSRKLMENVKLASEKEEINK